MYRSLPGPSISMSMCLCSWGSVSLYGRCRDRWNVHKCVCVRRAGRATCVRCCKAVGVVVACCSCASSAHVPCIVHAPCSRQSTARDARPRAHAAADTAHTPVRVTARPHRKAVNAPIRCPGCAERPERAATAAPLLAPMSSQRGSIRTVWSLSSLLDTTILKLCTPAGVR